MSGSAGGNRIIRSSVAKTVEEYINKVLSKFPGFKGAKPSGSYNTGTKNDFGDIDLVVNLTATDKKNIKVELAKYLSSLPDDVIVPFKSDKYKGKKFLNTGEIITILYPIAGQPDEYVQIDNIISISDEEAEFKKEFLDYPAEIQGLMLGLSKTICLEEDPKSIFARMGIKNIPALEPNQEYEFNLSSAGLTLRIVTLDNFKEIDKTDVWKTSNWSSIKKLFTNYNIDGSWEDLLSDLSSKIKNPRSKNRIKGIFNSMVSIKSGEVGTPKGDNKQKALDKVNSTLSETNLGKYLASILLEEERPTIALFPGAFKPPHKGHFDVVKQLLQRADQVVVLISPKTREGVTADESVAVWNLYKTKLDGSVEIKISAITPIGETYDVVTDNPDTSFIVAFGKGEIDRYKTMNEYPNATIFDAGEVEGVNATGLRMALLKDDNNEEIQKYLPEGITVEEFMAALGKTVEPAEPAPAPVAPAEPVPAAPAPEAPLQESPPLEFEQDDYQDYTLQNRHKIEKAAYFFNLPISDMEYAFNAGREVVLNDDIWSKLENSKSYKMKSLDDAIQHALKLGIDPKPYIDFIKEGKEMPLPLVLCYAQDKYYLVGGEVVLSLYRALGSIPTVIQGTLNLKINGPVEYPVINEGLDKKVNSNVIKEYSNKLVNDLTTKFKQEKPNLEVNIIQSYINRFAQIKDSPRVTEKDITKYNWKDLETIVDANQPKRIKAGKINDGEPSKDANLVYNQNGLRIYAGKTKNACIKYGNGYSFCISARGGDNMYSDYRYEQGGTPYFVFDDTKSSERDKNGKFTDPTHLLVIFIHPDPNGELLEAYNEYSDNGVLYYTVTTADNPGEDRYSFFKNIEYKYPRLKGLKNVFKGVEIDPKEKAEYELDFKYNNLLGNINANYGSADSKNYQEGFWNQYSFETIKGANEKIDDLINGKTEIYRFTGELKPTANPEDYMTSNISQFRSTKPGNVEEQYKEFIDNIIIPSYEGDEINHNIVDDWIITYKKTSTTETPQYKEYLKDLKQLVDKYRNDLSKLRLVNEGLEKKVNSNVIKEFIKFAVKELGITRMPEGLTLSYNTDTAKSRRSFGTFDPNDGKIWLYVKNRNMADVLRTLAHELVHRKQDEDGRIDYTSGNTGSEIENEANAQAGILLRKFGKNNENIYENKK